jgi:hypothetical protein
MTKQRGKDTTFFCLPEELANLLDPILAKAGAQLCIAEERGSRHYFRAFSAEDLNRVVPQFYVCTPAMAATGGLVSLANLVEAWFPVFKDRRLRMGRVALLAAESELSEEQRKLQEEFYRDARKALTTNFRRGVLGKSSKTGGEHFYEDILISDRAASAYAEGVVLASLLGDGFVTFHVTN